MGGSPSFSPDGRQLIVSAFGGEVSILDAETAGTLFEGLSCNGLPATESLWFPAQRIPLIGAFESATTGSVCEVDPATGKATPLVRTSAVVAPQISPDGKLYIGLNLDPFGTFVHDLPSGILLGKLPGLGIVSPDGRTVVSSGRNGDLVVVGSRSDSLAEQGVRGRRAQSFAGRMAAVLPRRDVPFDLPDVGSGDGRDVGPDQLGLLLVDAAVAARGVIVAEVLECGKPGDGVGIVVAVTVEREMHERVVGEAQHDVADVGGLGLGELGEHPLDAALILVGGVRRGGGVAGDEPELDRSVGRHVVQSSAGGMRNKQNIAPCGSVRTAIRPTGMSKGSMNTVPPSSLALAAVASTSSAPK